MSIHQRNCPKCSNTITYELKRLLDYAIKHNRVCKSCKEEERKQKRIRTCPLCQKVIIHKSSSITYHAKRLNSPCKKCSARIEADKLLEKERVFWTGIFGVIPKNKKVYERWKQIWYHRLTAEEKLSVLNKTTQQKIYFWGHIKRKNKVISKRNVKEAFVKWCGDNHWMKRPEVLEKVIKSCEKYKGDHHWFRLAKIPIE